MILPDRPMPRWEMRTWLRAVLMARELIDEALEPRWRARLREREDVMGRLRGKGVARAREITRETEVPTQRELLPHEYPEKHHQRVADLYPEAYAECKEKAIELAMFAAKLTREAALLAFFDPRYCQSDDFDDKRIEAQVNIRWYGLLAKRIRARTSRGDSAVDRVTVTINVPRGHHWTRKIG